MGVGGVPLCWSWLGYPPPLEETWDKKLGSPPPRERIWDQGPMSRNSPLPLRTDKVKTLPSLVLRNEIIMAYFWFGQFYFHPDKSNINLLVLTRVEVKSTLYSILKFLMMRAILDASYSRCRSIQALLYLLFERLVCSSRAHRFGTRPSRRSTRSPRCPAPL